MGKTLTNLSVFAMGGSSHMKPILAFVTYLLEKILVFTYFSLTGVLDLVPQGTHEHCP